MAYVAASLVRELSRRMGDLVLSVPTAPGTTTTLIDSALDQYYPANPGNTTSFLNVWVYGVAAALDGLTPADQNNRGVERRAKSWSIDSHTLSFYTAWPSAPTAGTYEIHQRSQRSRKLEALNDAVRQLNLAWYRRAQDEVTLTTVQNQWRYSIPNAAALWSSIDTIEIQMNPSFADYPYADASAWDPHIEQIVDAAGNPTLQIQFGLMPPPGRIVRLRGTAGYPDLANETDVLGLTPVWSEALAWIYDWAEYRLYQWESNKQPSGQTERLRQSMQDRLQAAKMYLLENQPEKPNARLVVPGRGTGQLPYGPTSPEWLAAFHTPT
jgi:hypothetical protein